MFRRAITRRTLTGSGNALQEGVGREPQAVVDADPRVPAEQLARARDVGPGIADVARSFREELAVDGKAEQRADRLGELVDRGRASGGDVQHLAVDVGRLGGEEV